MNSKSNMTNTISSDEYNCIRERIYAFKPFILEEKKFKDSLGHRVGEPEYINALERQIRFEMYRYTKHICSLFHVVFV